MNETVKASEPFPTPDLSPDRGSERSAPMASSQRGWRGRGAASASELVPTPVATGGEDYVRTVVPVSAGEGSSQPTSSIDGDGAGPSFEGIRVLVIDDSKTIRRTAETLLAKAGCAVITADDGFQALSLIVDHRPDIIFVDIMMPRLDGYQTCALIKRNHALRDTPVIMLSSKDGLFDRARGRVGRTWVRDRGALVTPNRQ